MLGGLSVPEGEALPELPEPGFLLLGQGPICRGVVNALLPSFFQALVDGGAVPVSSGGRFRPV